MKKSLFRILAGVGTIAASLVILASGATAQSNGLGVTPRVSYTVQAGQQASNTLYLNNLDKTQPLVVSLRVVDFEASGENGAAKLLQGADQPLTPWSLKPYLSLPDTVTVPPGQTKFVPFTVKMPANIGAGTYYSAIEYIAGTSNTQQQVSIAASTATLMFINVPGQVNELMTMQSFGLASSETGSTSSVFHKSPSYFQYRIKNSGNVAEQPSGSLIIKNIFGRVAAHVDNVNPKTQLALIGQTRNFTGCNPKSTNPGDLPKDSNCVAFNLSPGFYTATLAVYYGQNGQETRQIGATAHFWYLPWSTIIIALLILAAIIILLYRLFHQVRRRR